MSAIVPPLAVSSAEKYVDGEAYTRYEYADNSYGFEDKKNGTLVIYHPDGSRDVYQQKKDGSADYGILQKYAKDGTVSTTVDVNDQEIDKMVKERAHWLCEQYIEANNSRLQEIKSLNNSGKNKYVRDMFERIGHGRMYANYCITAQLNCLQDVCDASGNLNGSYDKNTNCRNFIANMKKKGYGDCFTNNPKKEDIHPGDMIFTPRGGGNYHVVSVKEVYFDQKGKRHIIVNGFNNDNCYEFSGGKCVVFNTEKYMEIALTKELEQQNFMQSEKDGNTNGGSRQMNQTQYAEMIAYLTDGMPAGENDGDGVTGDMHALQDIEVTISETLKKAQEEELKEIAILREKAIPYPEDSILRAEENSSDDANIQYEAQNDDIITGEYQGYINPRENRKRETAKEKIARLRQERAERQARREELKSMRIYESSPEKSKR